MASVNKYGPRFLLPTLTSSTCLLLSLLRLVASSSAHPAEDRYLPCVTPKNEHQESTNPQYRLAKIADGTEAVPGAAPWLVSLQDTSYAAPVHFCGASLLTMVWVLTSASCVHGYGAPYNFRVVAGEHDLSVDEGTEQVRSVAEVILHPDFDYYSKDFDVALVALTSPLNNNKFVSTISLPNIDQAPVGENCGIVGWGSTGDGGVTSAVVLQGIVPVLPEETCRNAYPDMITDAMLCAGNLTHGGADECPGDYGGPLVCANEERGIGEARGVASWGSGCGVPGTPGVYINTGSVSNWVHDVICLYDASMCLRAPRRNL
ncbi:trypsin-1-like isoform X2 [Oratosquilla oratoria]|uniref:trypsin-1-like isoform X2 n=1 Tax=Oratosquilla oratoria TaxID=337810 RepID=UPI003F76AC58